MPTSVLPRYKRFLTISTTALTLYVEKMLSFLHCAPPPQSIAPDRQNGLAHATSHGGGVAAIIVRPDLWRAFPRVPMNPIYKAPESACLPANTTQIITSVLVSVCPRPPTTKPYIARKISSGSPCFQPAQADPQVTVDRFPSLSGSRSTDYISWLRGRFPDSKASGVGLPLHLAKQFSHYTHIQSMRPPGLSSVNPIRIPLSSWYR